MADYEKIQLAGKWIALYPNRVWPTLNLYLADVSPPPLSRWIMPERISSETGRAGRQRIFGQYRGVGKWENGRKFRDDSDRFRSGRLAGQHLRQTFATDRGRG